MNRENRANSAFEYCISMGVSNVTKHAAMSIAAISVTTACILLIACLYLLSANTSANMKDFQAENAMLAFINDSFSDEQKLQLGVTLQKMDGIRQVRYITKEDAFETYKAQYGGDEMKYLSAAIFRDRYAIEIQKGFSVEEVRDAVKATPGVEEVRSDETITNSFQAAQSLIRLMGVVGAMLMGTVSFFIIINTLKLTVMNRKDEYAVMRMMGATDRFLRLPLVSEGAITGGFAALAAYLLSMLMYGGILKIMSGSGILDLINILPIKTIALPLLIIVLVLGFGIGIGGSYIAIRKYLFVE